MKILLNNKDLNEALNNVPNLGFVPTMGSLHKGHLSLIKKSNSQCKKTIVSIFVNPTQFDKKNDYKKYPRNTKRDLSILRKNKVDFLYIPKNSQIYKFKRTKKIEIKEKNKILCAKFRPGHFEGVLDVMDRLVSIIKPSKIYMGEKDLQQLILVKNYLQKKYKSKVVSCRTIRSRKKLALSSRNSLLKKKDIIIASNIIKNLIYLKRDLRSITNIKKFLNIKKIELCNLFNIKIEYLELRNMYNLKISNNLKDSKLFIAYHINKIRLIDNL
tara:strand:- start:876 stop:1688 length:813 start_codon:yes stop_codon:yes gene_type:complete